MDFEIQRSYFKKKEHRKEIKDISGTRYGHLLVVRQFYFELQKGEMSYELLCDCGNICIATANVLNRRAGKRHCSTQCAILKERNADLSQRPMLPKGPAAPKRKCPCGWNALFGQKFCAKCTHIDASVPVEKPDGFHRPVRRL